VLAALVLSGFYSVLAEYLPQLGISSGVVVVLSNLGVIIAGVTLGWLGSLFAVRRFIQNVAIS